MKTTQVARATFDMYVLNFTKKLLLRHNILCFYKIVGIVLCLFLCFGIHVYADLDEGLISAWTFDDGTIKDAVGNNNGEINGGVEVVNGKFGKALSFNGEDGFVQIPHDKSMEAIENSLSVSAWIYVRQGANCSAIVCKGEQVGWGSNYAFRIITVGAAAATDPNKSLSWGVCNAGTEGWCHTLDVIEPEKWFFVCLTADGTQAVGHVAGEDGEVTIPNSNEGNPHAVVAPYLTFPDSPIELGVGRAVEGAVGNDAFLDAVIDELYLWGRTLSEEEIEKLASGTKPKGISAVEPSGKLAITWGKIKRE